MSIIQVAVHALLLLISFALGSLGLDYIEFGYGLNPWIAFPIAAALLIFVVYHIAFGIIDEVEATKAQLEADRRHHAARMKRNRITFPHY